MKRNSWKIGQGLNWAFWRIRKPISVCLTLVLMIWVLAPAMSAASSVSKSDHKSKKEKKKDSKKDKKSDDDKGKKKDCKKDKKGDHRKKDNAKGCEDKDGKKKDGGKKDKKDDKHKKDDDKDNPDGDDGHEDDGDGHDGSHGGDDGHDGGGKDGPGDDDDNGEGGDDDIPVEPPNTPVPECIGDDCESAPPAEINKSYSVHIDKWDTVDPVTMGGTAQYYIRVYNNGKNKLTNVRVTDSLPGSFRFLTSSSGKTSWRLGSLPAGRSKTVWLVAKPGKVGKLFKNRATVTASEIRGGVSDTANTAVVNRQTTAASKDYDLAVSKTDNVSTVRVGSRMTYTITVKNQGTKALTNLTFKDWMSAGIAYNSSTTTVDRLSSGVYSWTGNDLAPGESRSFDVVTSAQKRGTWTNTVSVKANEIPIDEVATEETQIIGEHEIIAATDKNGKPKGGASRKATRVSGKAQAFSLSTPIAGFPVYLWWIVTFVLLSAGLVMEIRARMRRPVTQ